MQHITCETHHSSCQFRWGPPNLSIRLYITTICLSMVYFPSYHPHPQTQDLWSQCHVYIHSQGPFSHALPSVTYVLVVESHPKPSNRFLPLPFPTPPTLNVHSQGYPRVFIDDVGHADSRDDLQQVRGNSSIKSGYTLLGNDGVKQGQHGGFRGSLHWRWGDEKKMRSTYTFWSPTTPAKRWASGANDCLSNCKFV